MLLSTLRRAILLASTMTGKTRLRSMSLSQCSRWVWSNPSACTSMLHSSAFLQPLEPSQMATRSRCQEALLPSPASFGPLAICNQTASMRSIRSIWHCGAVSLPLSRSCSFQHLLTWITALKNVFAMVGASVGSYPADKIGRRWMILVVQIIMVGGCILEQLATHWTHWLGARFLDVRFPSIIMIPTR